MKMLNLVPYSAANDSATSFEAFGSHGTCMSRAISISNSGFNLSAGGRRGSGAYFWYAKRAKCRYAYSLAEAWYKNSFRRNDYSKDDDPTGAVIWGSVSAPNSEVLDLESAYFRDTLREALTHHWSTISSKDQPEKEKLVSQIHELLIRKTHDVTPVSIVLATVQQPPKMSDELLLYVGHPFAIIIRNLSCLEIDSEIEGIPA
ncbi:hypothetical protein [Pantoea agglomerans]|uniref:hypothetical protein n=1 Tax=Enterobacter agglomerans TaxID=549 RepID=UPI003C79BB25